MPSLPYDLPTAYGRLRGTFELADGEVGLAEFGRAALPIGEAYSELMASAYARGGKPASCRKGCGACCRQEIPISVPEALALAEFKATLPADRLAGVNARFDAIRAHVRAEAAAEPAQADPRARGLAWMRAYLACPFLENETCGAREHRPIACRNHMAWSAPENCSYPEDGGVKALNPRFSLGTVLALVTAEFCAEDPLKFPMGALEDWAAQNAAYAERRFPSDALAARFLALLEEFCLRSLPAPKAAPKPVTTPATSP